MTRSASHRDHVRPRNQPYVENEAVKARLNDLLTPTVYAQRGLYRQLGLRARILTLPLMMAAILTLLWRQVPSVRELCRVLNREDLLWCKATSVSQQALSNRLLDFPSELFEQVFKDLVPLIHHRWAERVQRPLPESVRVALRSFEQVWIADGSTLEALFRKLKSLEDAKVAELGGKMMVILDLVRQTPVAVWIEANPYTHDTAFMPRLHQAIPPKTLMILDRGFWDFRFFESLISQGAGFITRVRANGPIEVLKPLSESPWHRDSQVRLGKGYQGNPILTLRLVEVRRGQQWHTFLTSVLDPTVLPPGVVADLYQRRWRIEESFSLLKRLLGLSYLWTGSPNGIRLQVWATWIIYLVLVDLADDLANALSLPVERVSLEMIFRGLYHFSVAHSQGQAHDLIAYFTDPDNADLGTVKARRKKPPRLTFDPAPTTLTSETYA